jgi:hypothetical protein
LAADWKGSTPKPTLAGALAQPLSTAFTEAASSSIVAVLQVGAGLVLLIACANLAGLFLARSYDRRREVAVRTALGASQSRIVREVITETVLIGLIASVVAIVLARAGLDVLRTSIPADMAQHIEGWNNLRLDTRVAVAIPALAIGLGLRLGLIPAAAAMRTQPVSALREGQRSATGSVGRRRLRQVLVVAEIAGAVALLVGAGLSFTAGARMASQSGGFDAGQLLRFDLPLPETKYAEDEARRRFADDCAPRRRREETVM